MIEPPPAHPSQLFRVATLCSPLNFEKMCVATSKPLMSVLRNPPTLHTQESPKTNFKINCPLFTRTCEAGKSALFLFKVTPPHNVWVI